MKFLSFSNELFHEVCGLSTDVQLFLTACIFKWYEDFQRIIQDDPKKRWNNTSLHPFLACLHGTAAECNVSTDLFSVWCKELKDDYLRKNIFTLPMEETQHLDSSLVVDGRSLIEKQDCLARCVSVMDQNTVKMQNMLEQVSNKLDILTKNVDKLQALAYNLQQSTSSSIETINKNQMKFQSSMENMIEALQNRNFEKFGGKVNELKKKQIHHQKSSQK